MTDICIIRINGSNVIAKGRRYGRWWLIKGIRADLAGNTSLKIRLIKEFELQSRLQHPGIAKAVSIEEIDELGTCIIMEWIEGDTLSDTLLHNTCSPGDRKRIMNEIIEAVAYFHSQGVVHRDLKPSNIMIRHSGGKAVIIDFGLADSDDYTELKYPAGTSGFISPEQIRDGGVNTSDDVYSLGVIINALCPEYRSIARKCTRPRPKRISDASQLLKLFKRRQRRLKSTFISAYIAAFFVLIATASVIIFSLQRDWNKANNTIIGLKELNNRNASRIASLKDSLDVVNRNFSESEKLRLNTENYLAAKNEAMEKGCKNIDAILKRYDRDSISYLRPEDWEIFNRRHTALLKLLEKTIDNYYKSLKTSSLRPEDIEAIRRDLYNHSAIAFSEYQTKWLKTIRP